VSQAADEEPVQNAWIASWVSAQWAAAASILPPTLADAIDLSLFRD